MAMPRATSPAASERGLPTSLMTRSVISAARAARASAAAPSAEARAGAGTCAQSRAAAVARATTAGTSASSAVGHSPMTSAGSCGFTLTTVMNSPQATPCHAGLSVPRRTGHYQGGPIGYARREFEIAPRQPGRAGGDLMTLTGAEVLARRGISAEPVPAPATLRFPDGAHFRIEIPSVEGPEVLRAVVDQAAAEGVTINRVSQGSGAMLLSAAELTEMAHIGAAHGIEVSLFVGPREEWDVGSLAQSGEGASRAGLIRGVRQLRYAIDDVLRGVEHGIRGFLVADTGLLELLAEMQSRGEIPASVVWKVSAMLAPSNPVTVYQLERLGASTINVPSDVTLGQLAEMRAATSVPIDLYVEAPSGMGGVVRGQEAADLVAVAAPMYVKFGLRNSRMLYPSGLHLVDEAARIAREKVHRASVALEWIRRSGLDLVQSGPGATGLGVPEPS